MDCVKCNEKSFRETEAGTVCNFCGTVQPVRKEVKKETTKKNSIKPKKK